MQKTLIILGAAFLVAGLLWPYLGRIPLGRLPGDILIDKPGLKIFIPITSMVVVSIVVSILLWLIRK
jgi:hypothetical protein